ncbi:MAG: RNA-binding domain-containing protein [Eubacteriales bacterium]|jgi:ATP-dependent DNA helicase RecG
MSINNRESEILEYKKSTAQLKEAVISLCAMLNKHKKGAVYFGIKDDGVVCGQNIGKKTTSDISHEIRNNLKPIPNVSITVETIDDKDVVKIEASGEDTPYSAYGRYYTRVDDSDIFMDSRQLWKHFESKNKTYSKWEEKITAYGIDKINEDLLIQFIRDANENGRLNYIYRNPEEALSKLNLINEDGFLNNAGYFLFGNDGPVLLKEVVYPTDERNNFTDLKQFKGNILECINEGLKYIQNNIHYHAEIVGTKRQETPEIPIEALREILINSFAHCHYQEGDYNEISITKSSVRIYNPGGILNDTNPKDFASGKVGSKIRNPLIATVLFKNGMIDAFGTGFDRTFKLCALNGVDYDYQNDEYGFTFIFHRNENDKISDKISDKIKNLPNVKLTKVDDQIIKILKRNAYSTIPEIAEAIGKSSSTVNRHIDKLVSLGMMERVGSRKSGYWEIKK